MKNDNKELRSVKGKKGCLRCKEVYLKIEFDLKVIKSNNDNVSIIKSIMFSNNVKVSIGNNGVLKVGILGSGSLTQILPFFFSLKPIFLDDLQVLNEVERRGILISQRLFEGLVIDFFEDSLERVEGFL